jgi:hypothetical protein
LNRSLVPVAHFTDWNEAHIACGFLKANGLGAVLHDTNLASMGIPVAQGVGGIRLMVPDYEAKEAALLLQDVASGALSLNPDLPS